ncbi:1-acyl-sn-glycerol-3-phosphate acyltransferase [Ameyamaea chiangmaiensis NBRC 103196]|uniref:1-acyl-sn-glycerol-3-phosphate acyltransferase n=1 Tax=Ameyamaea chiangmaiensis TaxID=442969 RepID=A0A850PE95_9PROT|nr:lysophospholipid acyltransferase family protein [Ameyamaea chiangmaiensis]MBS4075350.1 1-acyl-sn-glycerol-3-phosphate acyltransferase [Ameyamaea chiangmaiensis]NVN41193.1 1-acyl-sn-glycerol-3-phosphate acyltransferase [Ameyamaea chiangmaiensis]GBQ70083.1 1-acyl-sn-glycerol-3-phosphate acyltransferase [Ameyamaea chiangmaiensis NBRC 103196]
MSETGLIAPSEPPVVAAVSTRPTLSPHRARRPDSPPHTARLPVLPSRLLALAHRIRAGRRIACVLILAAICAVVQSVLILLPGRMKIRFARFFWACIARQIGLRVRVLGTLAGGIRAESDAAQRPVIFVANHSSWADVAAIGGVVPAVFVAKDQVRTWPVISTVARLGRTIFVSRQRGTTGRERDDMATRIRRQDNLILFPEGTSSDGSRVLPFLSSFFAIAKPQPRGETPIEAAFPTPLVQPVSIVYDRLDGLPVGRARRSVFAWYGDMDLAPHIWRLTQWRSMRVTIMLHPPLDPDAFPSRKALAVAAWQAVADGAATLRQNSPVPE